MISLIFLHFLGGLCIFFALQVLRMSFKPVHSILYLIGCFVIISIFLLGLKVEFLALIYITVYVGAIAVLFLFVIMMLDLKVKEVNTRSIFAKNWAFGGLLLVIVFFLLLQNDWVSLKNVGTTFYYQQQLPVLGLQTPTTFYKVVDIYLIGLWLYNIFGEVVIFVGLFLLVAMVGAIILVFDNKRIVEQQRKHQNEALQLNRTIVKSISLGILGKSSKNIV